MRKTHNKIEHDVSSGNVFADLGVAHPEEALAKARLARAICLLIEKETRSAGPETGVLSAIPAKSLAARQIRGGLWLPGATKHS